MRRPDDLVGTVDALDQLADTVAPEVGDAVADRIRDVEGLGASLDHRLKNAAEKVHVGTNSVFRRELDIVGELPRELHRSDSGLDHLVRLHAQLLLHMDRRGGDEGVDALARCRRNGVASGLDVTLGGTCQRAHGGVLDHLGHRADGLGVAGAGGRESGLDDVDTQLLELAGDAHLLLAGHGRAGALFAVAEGGIEDVQMVAHVGALMPRACLSGRQNKKPARLWPAGFDSTASCGGIRFCRRASAAGSRV